MKRAKGLIILIVLLGGFSLFAITLNWNTISTKLFSPKTERIPTALLIPLPTPSPPPEQDTKPKWTFKPAVNPPKTGFRILSRNGLPLITEADLIKYEWKTHTMHLQPGVVQRLLKELKWEFAAGDPFQVEADGVVYYTGVFTNPLSSIALCGIVIDFTTRTKSAHRSEDHLSLHLGYPSERQFRETDLRGNEHVFQALRRLGKLE